ncbi:transposase [Candidatus Binatus soli]|jgi:DDE family transposase|uniref:transposase n=1 Tax=Candidatus Binatus soli TaxID=1953413 RepID=UPI003D0E36EA
MGTRTASIGSISLIPNRLVKGPCARLAREQEKTCCPAWGVKRRICVRLDKLKRSNSLRVDFQGARVTSDGGLILARELDERLGLSALMQRHLTDSRRGKNTQLPLADLLRQSI